jgi:4'-phosphopantetheinyl transferase EntD
MGIHVVELPRSARRHPLWPAGVVGSIAHDADFAAAAVGATSRVTGLGIDIEPAEHLPACVRDVVASAHELKAFADLSYSDKALFSIKEAVFKAVYPHDGVGLEFNDIIVVREPQIARTRYGRVVGWRVLSAPRVLAIAWW